MSEIIKNYNKKYATTSREKWRSVLQEILDKPEFKEIIEEQGYYPLPKWTEFVKNYELIKDGSLGKAPEWISLDFWSKPSPTTSTQESILTDKGYYILRSGNGAFRIFDEKIFPKPYLDLKLTDIEKLEYPKENHWNKLENTFSKTKQENPGLEFLNAFGIFDLIVEKLFGKQEWRVGPRGLTQSKFTIYAKNIKNEIEKLYDFKGQEELDYTIWTKDQILLIEAKSSKKDLGLNLGWHKIVYPASRFREIKNYKITPVYILRYDKIFYIFIFPVLNFYNNDGIIINDIEKLKPTRVFSVSIETSLD
jgi:hypothetical protein